MSLSLSNSLKMRTKTSGGTQLIDKAMIQLFDHDQGHNFKLKAVFDTAVCSIKAEKAYTQSITVN